MMMSFSFGYYSVILKLQPELLKLATEDVFSPSKQPFRAPDDYMLIISYVWSNS